MSAAARRAKPKQTEASPLVVVNAFFDAIESGDFERAEERLSVEHFTYEGPIERFDNAGAFILSISRIGAILEGLKRRRMFVDGNEVCAILTYETTVEAIKTTRIAHWIRVEKGRITRIESFFDARGYAGMFDSEP
ncbi:MAG TPA: nuclear transport factor 2 family protein [Gammaproteobacteria bacterium]|nr:nuclear transport factor 2 family protein [Gammaproteobacteria bacterium]